MPSLTGRRQAVSIGLHGWAAPPFYRSVCDFSRPRARAALTHSSTFAPAFPLPSSGHSFISSRQSGSDPGPGIDGAGW